MAQLLPTHGSIRNPLQKHQRRKVHQLAPFPVDQVNDQGNGERGEAGEEERGEKRQGYWLFVSGGVILSEAKDLLLSARSRSARRARATPNR